MIKINVFSDEEAWTKKIKKKEIFFKKICQDLPQKYKFNGKKISLNLLLSNNKNIKKLNKKFRKKNKSTDILSFPFYEKKNLKKIISKEKRIYLGDIIINLNKINDKKDKKKFKDQLNKLWIHGFFHLLGHNHKLDKEYFKMQKLENKFFKFLK